MSNIVQLFLGSACDKQPGKGAWATILRCGGASKELFGTAAVTTNNRMALIAVIKGLRALNVDKPRAVHIVTNVQYVTKGANEWLEGWKADGRLSSGGIENAELWREIDKLQQLHFVDWIWQKSEMDPMGVRVSEIAKTALTMQ